MWYAGGAPAAAQREAETLACMHASECARLSEHRNSATSEPDDLPHVVDPGERSAAKLLGRKDGGSTGRGTARGTNLSFDEDGIETGVAGDEEDGLELAPVTEAARWRHFLARCANDWCARSGGEALRQAPGERTYEALATGSVSETDAEQIAMDVERSGVDDLQLIAAPSFDEAAHLVSLRRLLTAMCCRTPGLYCQGMNFVASVLLAVAAHGQAPPEPGSARGEADAFWTLLGVLSLLPADFYEAPSMPGLQCEARVLKELVRAELRACEGATIPAHPLSSVLQLVSYKWFVPLYVNQLPLRTLVLYWDALLIPRAPRAAPRPPGPRDKAGWGFVHKGGAAAYKRSPHGHWSAAAAPAAAAASSTRAAGVGGVAEGGAVAADEGAPPWRGAAAAPSSAAHLQMALALLGGAMGDARRAIAASGDEAMGVAFDKVLRHALAATAAPPLLAAAARYDLEPERLRWLRRRLASPAEGGGGAPDAALGRMQRTALRLAARRRDEAALTRLLKESLLLRPPRPLPAGSLALLRRVPGGVAVFCASPPQLARLASACSVLLVSVFFWGARALLLGRERA